jgi:hypothetical protein
MIYFKLAIAIFIPFLLGVFGISAILRERLQSFAYFERLAIAFAIGVWMLVLIMFSLPFIKVALTFQNISLTASLFLVGLAPFSLKFLHYFLPKSRPKSKSFWFYLILFLIAIKVLFVFWSALLKPMIGPDIIKCYALSVKHAFLSKVPLYPGNKPPLPFLAESWPVISVGGWIDTLLPLLYPFMYLSLLVIFYSSLKRYFSELYALFFTFLLASIPFLLLHAGTAYVDFPQAFYYSIATIYFSQFVKEYRSSKNKAYSMLVLGTAFLGMSIWAKKSGLYYAGINIFVLLSFLALHWKSIQKVEWSSLTKITLLFMSIVSPWLVYHKFLTLGFYSSQVISSLDETGTYLSLLTRNMVIFPIAFKNMFLEGNWQLLWILFLAVLIFFPKKSFSLPNLALVIIIFLQLTALYTLFGYTNLFKFILDDSLFNRLMLHFAPVVLYFCAETCSSKEGTGQ